MQIRHIALSSTVAVGLAFGGVHAALAKDCLGETLSGTYKEIYVPEGYDCTLDGATVRQNVKADKALSLTVIDTFIRNGNLDAVEVGTVLIDNARLKNGDIKVDKSGDVGGVRVLDSTLDNGNLDVVDGFVQTRVNRNDVDNGNIKVEKNEDARVNRNTASDDIVCKDNMPLFRATGNVAGGDLECDS